jgi:hypothetical protein
MKGSELAKPDNGGSFPNAERCSAIAKGSGERCKNPAMNGLGVCRVHGGAGIRAAAKSNLRHGRYSTYLKDSNLKDAIKDMEERENPLDLLPEVAALRGIFTDFVNRYEENHEALLLWADSWESKDDDWSPGKPKKVLDIADAYRILSEISKVVERIEKVRAQNAVSRSDLLRIMQEMGRVVERYVKDQAVLEKIQDGWLAVKL